ncbi:DUF4139 domain-containing protein [Neolewinella antarctica]|uniref:Uncharacterized protein n=1 Tax=Neolewinella antarctica TaxID=442734 RepID=A0ABX0X6X3_9BACT|nr:DUF4139 domain-containing protein [Neolewinella antarctica]NJC24739.1 hypothetical protein [Neolewinella antarctica]
MIGKMKQWLGIEGVKLELKVPPEFSADQGLVTGTVRLTSKSPQSVSAIKLTIIEKYTRGRDEDIRVDEYQLGSVVLRQPIMVPGEGVPVSVAFSLAYETVSSPVEAFGNKNFLFKGLAWVAKQSRNASSEFRIEAEAQVQGVGLNPFDKTILGG